MSTYTDTIRRWATDLRRSGPLEDADGTGEVGLGADEAGRRLAVRFALRVRDGRAESVRFQVFGCGFTIAACAAAAALAEGSRLEEIPAVTTAAVDDVLDGLPAERGYCADLAVAALQAAVASAGGDAQAVQAAVNPREEDHGPRISADDPLYRALMAGSATDVPEADRRLFACLLCVAAREAHDTAAALGLTPEDVAAILESFFPGADPALLARHAAPAAGPSPEHNETVLGILLSHVPQDKDGCDLPASAWLARIIAARAARPGHLWRAMGLFDRPELSRAIRRHLPSLAAANNKGMRWKRYLFKQVCEVGGGIMCKAPDCGVCSDYSLCFESDQ